MMQTKKKREEELWHELYREWISEDEDHEEFSDFLVSKILRLSDELELEKARWDED